MDVLQDYDFGPFLVTCFGDHYLHPVNHTTFNQVGSKEFYRKYFGERFAEKQQLHVLIGADSGLLLDYLCDEEIGSGTKLLVVDFAPIIDRIGEVFDFSRLPGNIILASSADWQDHLEGLDIEVYSHLDSIFVNESVGVSEGHLPDYRDLVQKVKMVLEDQRWTIKAKLAGKIFYRRQLENITENRIPAILLKNQFCGRTAVILGAGPSLDDALPWVKENLERLIVIAVSRVSGRLLEVGVVPHIVVTGDPETVSFSVGREMLKLDPSVLLINACHAYPRLVRLWLGRQMYLGTKLPWESELNEENINILGPTIGNVAINIAKELGCSQIILSGVDLCHSPDGFSHALGNPERQLGPNVGNLYQMVETYSGHLAESPHAYYAAVTALSEQVAELKKKNCLVFNVSLAAAKVDGVEYRPFKKIKLPPVEESFSTVLADVFPDDSKVAHRQYLQRLRAEISRVQSQLQKVENLSREGLRDNASIFGRSEKTADFKCKKQMGKIEKKLNSEYKGLIPLIKRYGFELFLKTVRPDESLKLTNEEAEEIGSQYCNAYLSSSLELGQRLEMELFRIDTRLLELSDQPDINILFERWQDESPYDDQDHDGSLYNGCWRWLQKNTLPSCLPLESKKNIEAIAQRLFDWLGRGNLETWDEKDREELKEYYFKIDKVRAKAVGFFKDKSLAGLRFLLQGLDKYSDVDGVTELRGLVSGYIAELEQKPDRALEFYHDLVTSSVGPFTEEALSRIASISVELKDHQNALLALECLAGISPNYQISYAEMLKMLGRTEDAVMVYNDYLTKVPDDLTAMNKLGKLYFDIKAFEASGMAYRYILDVDPDNSTAQTMLKTLETIDAKQ